jgi:hypothetical protein
MRPERREKRVSMADPSSLSGLSLAFAAVASARHRQTERKKGRPGLPVTSGRLSAVHFRPAGSESEVASARSSAARGLWG